MPLASRLVPGRRHDGPSTSNLGARAETMADLVGQATGDLPHTDYYTDVTAPMPERSLARRAADVPRAIGAGLTDVSTGFWGGVRAAAEAAGLSSIAEAADRNAKLTTAAGETVMGDLVGAGQTERALYSGLRSIGAMAPSLAAGAAGGAAVGLGLMGGMTAGQAYQRAREKGVPVGEAARYAAIDGVIEMATERIPMSRLLGDLAQQTGAVRTILNQVVTEVPGEQVATLGQDLNEWAYLRPDATFGDYLRERPSAAADTLIATLTATLGLSAGAVALDRAARRPSSIDVLRDGVGGDAARLLTDTAEDQALGTLTAAITDAQDQNRRQSPPVAPDPAAAVPGVSTDAPAPASAVAAGPTLPPEFTAVGEEPVPAVPEPVGTDSTENQDTDVTTDMFGNPIPTADTLAGTIAEVDPQTITADPARFQFKQNTDRSGVTNEARIDGPWNPNRGGILLVWRDPADGRDYVVNGHHRLEAAKRLGADKVAVRYIAARDANEALIEGALTNIAEGRGTPVDVAKVVRQAQLRPEDLAAEGVNPRTALARDGLALATLADGIFHKVAVGEIPTPQAAAIGAANLTPEGQAAVLELWQAQEKKGRTLTPGQVAELARDAATSAEVATDGVQGDIFGNVQTQNTAVEKAVLRDWLKKELAKDRKLFGFVTKGTRAADLAKGGNVIDTATSKAIADEAKQAEAVFGQLAHAAGPVASAINAAAVELASGKKPDAVRTTLLAAVKAALATEFGGRPAAPGQPQRPPTDQAGRPRDDRGRDADAGAEVAPRKFSSTQVDLPADVASRVRALAATIPSSDLAEDGREADPHITVQYGIDSDDVAPLRKALADLPPITATLGKTSLFENDDADVVKIDIDSPDLRRVREAIRTVVDAPGDTHPKYVPHATVAYVKPGKGQAYADKADLDGQTVTIDRITFSTRDRQTIEIQLTGKKTEGDAPPSQPATLPKPIDVLRDFLPEVGMKASLDLEPAWNRLFNQEARRLKRTPTRGEMRKAVEQFMVRAKASYARAMAELEAERTKATAEPPAQRSRLEQHDDVIKRLYNGDVTPDELRAGFERLVSDRATIKASLSTQTKDALLKRMGGMSVARYKNEKKAVVVDAAWRSIVQDYVLGDSISYGLGGSDSLENAVRRQLETATAETVAEYAAKIAERRDAHKKRVEGYVKAIKNPETLEEFDTFVRAHKQGEAGLTPEQRARYDTLRAEAGRETRKAEQEKKATVQAASETVGATIIETEHTRDKYPLFVVQLAARVSRDDYQRLVTAAKKLGGWYSSFKGNGAVPGFQFKERASAESFQKLAAEGDTAAVKEAVVERREERAEERKSAAADRLSEMADKMEAKAEESLSRDRLANTARRAAMASSADAAARASQAMARTLRNLAEAMRDGEAKHLEGIRFRTQVEALDNVLVQAQYEFLRQSGKNWTDENVEAVKRNTSDEVIRLVRFADMKIPSDSIPSMLGKLAGVRGTKQLADRIRKRVGGPDTWVHFDPDEARAFNEALIKAGEKGGDWRLRTGLEQRDQFARMGLEDDATLRTALREYVQFRQDAPKKDRVKELERKLAGQKGIGFDFFPTPEPLARRMAEALGLEPGMRVLEPSAGKGNLADAVRAVEPEAVIETVEQSSTLREILEAKGYPLVGHDFNDFEPEESYDRIIMNPPFSEGIDADHVRKAYEHLKPGGKLVAITGEGIFFRSDKKAREFREWFEAVGGESESMKDAFQDRREVATTGVASRLLTITKPERDGADQTVEDYTDELRADLGVSRAALDAYDPAEAVSKLGRHWIYRTLAGTDHQSLFDTKAEAVAAATRHKELKEEQFDNPSGFRDIVSVRARKRLALIEQYQRQQGMSEMEAGARALREMPDPARKEETRPLPFTAENLKSAFGLTDEQAAGVMALAESMGLDTSKITIAIGGEPGEGSLPQGDPILRDLLDTGEEQPRLPDDVGAVRDLEVPTPREALPEPEFRLTAEPRRPKKAKQPSLLLDGEALFQPAYHGSPHLFEQFSLQKIGTGEGAQAYGYGLYFSGMKAVAEHYRKALSGVGKDKAAALNGVRLYDLDGGIMAVLRDDGKNDPTTWSDETPTDVRRTAERAGLTRPELYQGLMEIHTRGYFARPGDLRFMREDLAKALVNLERDAKEEGQRFSQRWRLQEYRAALKVIDAFGDALSILPADEKPGRLYKVEIPDDGDFLDYDKPVSEQPQKIQEALARLDVESAGPWEMQSGSDAYGRIIRAIQRDNYDADAPRLASERLAAEGIAGITYLGDRRVVPGGARNYVVFDDKLVKIMDFEQGQGQGAKASVEFIQSGEALIRALQNPDVSSAVHEVAHIARRWLLNRDVPAENRKGITDEDIATTEQWAGAKDGVWTRDAEEKFARGFERYLRDGGPTLPSKIRGVFAKMAEWLQAIYTSVQGSPIDVEISPEMRQVFDRLVTRKERNAEAAKPKATTPPTKADSPVASGPSQDADAVAAVDAQLKLMKREKTGGLPELLASLKRARKEAGRGRDVRPIDAQIAEVERRLAAKRAPSGTATVASEPSNIQVKTGTLPRTPGRTLFTEDEQTDTALATTGPRALTAIRPVQIPEMVELAKALAQIPQVVKRFRGDRRIGDFTGIGRGRIRLLASLFARTAPLTAGAPVGTSVVNPATGQKFTVVEQSPLGPVLEPVEGGNPVTVTAEELKRGKYRADVADENTRQLAQTLAHEIGHLVDWLPDKTLKRGNLLGRLQSLHAFLAHTYTAQGGETIHRDDIRQELIGVSKAWRGDFVEKGGGSYDKYRQRGKELYADAISALLNNPGWLEQEAPTFYREFFDLLRRKPDVEAAYFGLQELLSGTPEELIARRRGNVRRMFTLGDAKAKDVQDLLNEERRLSRENLATRLRIELVDKNTPVLDAEVDKPQATGSYALREMKYLNAQQEAFLQRTFQPVYRTVLDAGIDWSTFGEALMYARIVAGDRSEMANPLGHTVETATELMADLTRSLTPEQRTTLTTATAQFRAAVREVSERAYQSGLYKPELYAQMQQNPAWASFRVIDHMDKQVTSTVAHQIGTLKEIQNPADATILKVLVTQRAVEYNEMKKAVFGSLDPSDIEQADHEWNGRSIVPKPPKDSRKALVEYMEGGKRRGKYVPTDVADAIENASIGRNLASLEALRLANARWFRPVFTTMNSGFQVANFARDFLRYWSNMKDATLLSTLRAYRRAIPMARMRAFETDPETSATMRQAWDDLREAKEAKILSATFADLAAGRVAEDLAIEETFAQHGLGSGPPTSRTPVGRLLDFLDRTGTFIETLPKAAAIHELRGDRAISELTPKERAFIREKVGSPDFLQGGTLKPLTNELFLFSNAIVQAVRADYQVATDPETRGAFWRKNATAFLLPAALTFTVEYFGHLLDGDDEDEDDPTGWRYVQRILQGVSEYDKTNYTIIPLALDAQGNSVYLRLPRSDSGRLLGAIFRKALLAGAGDGDLGASLSAMFDYAAGQVPGTTPVLDLAVDVRDYAAGRNPYDSFRNREVFTEDEMRAGGRAKAEKFFWYEFQQLGGNIVYKTHFDRPREETTGQKILAAPVVSNVLGRFLRISNYGQIERLRTAQNRARSSEARTRLTRQDEIRDAVRLYMQEPPPNRTKARALALARDIAARVYADASAKDRQEKARDIAKRIRMGAIRGEADALTDAVMGAASTQERVAIIRQHFKGRTEARDAWVRRALREEILSAAAAKAVLATPP